MRALDNEQNIISIFKNTESVFYKNKWYKVKVAEKPRYYHGEEKTDVYLQLSDGFEDIEIKITTKMTNAEFLENKLKPHRAKLFGENWSNIITNYALSLRKKFESRILYNENKNSCTVGWRVDISSKPRALSQKIMISNDFKREILLGTSLTENKRNVKIGDKIVIDAGVANYILLNSELYTTGQEIIDALLTIDQIDLNCYIAFCAINYFIDRDKGESSRSLGVYVDWSSGEPVIIYNQPLVYTSTDIYKIIRELV